MDDAVTIENRTKLPLESSVRGEAIIEVQFCLQEVSVRG